MGVFLLTVILPSIFKHISLSLSLSLSLFPCFSEVEQCVHFISVVPRLGAFEHLMETGHQSVFRVSEGVVVL